MNPNDFLNLVVRRHWLTIAVCMLVMMLLAAGGARIVTVDVDFRNQFDKDNPHLVELDEFEELFALSDSAIAVIAPSDGKVFTRQALVAIEQLTDQLWQAPYVVRVDSLANHSHSEGIEDELIVEPLFEDAASLSDEQLERVQSIALDTPEIAARFISRDGRVAGLIISFALPDSDREQAKIDVVDYIKRVADEARASNPGSEYHFYGEVFLNRAVRDAINNDVSILAPIALGTMLLVAMIVLRSFLAMLAIVATLMAVLISALGFTGWTGMRLYGESGAALFVLMSIAIAHSVHIIQVTADGMRRGMKRNLAAIYSLQINVWPVFLTSLTTAIGFLSLNFSDMPPFRVMGNIVAFGAMCAFVYSVTLLPALLSVMPIRVRAAQEGKIDFLDHLARFVVSNSTRLLWIFVALTVVLVMGITRIHLDENHLDLLDESYEVRRSTDFIMENFSALEPLEYSLDSGREGGITDVEYLQNVEEFAQWLRVQPEVSYVVTITDVLKRLNKNLHGDDPEFYVLPDDSDLVAQYLLLYEFSLPVGRDLNNVIDVERSKTRLTAVVKGMSNGEKIEFDNRAKEWLQQNAPQMATGATGVTIVGAYSVKRNIVKMLIGTFFAMLIVSLLLIFVFRSLRFGLISLIPNFVPAIMAMGIWGYLVGRVDVSASVVTAIAFGIIVDDTIHLMTKYLRARASGKSPSDAIAPVFQLVGRPLLTTTAIFTLGFMVFGTSALAANQTLGVLVGLTIVIAVVADLLLFPPLLIALDKFGKPGDGREYQQGAAALSGSRETEKEN